MEYSGYSPAELFLSFSVKTIATRLPLDPHRFSKANHCMSRQASHRKKYFDRRARDRTFHENQPVLLKGPYTGKLMVQGKEVTVVKQLNKSVVEVEKDGKRETVSTSNISPIMGDGEEESRKQVRFEEPGRNWKTRLRPRPDGFAQMYLESGRRGM
jgi:hypothetical protein